MDQLPGILRENRQAGDQEARLLSRQELLEEAPELSAEALGAVLCPYEGEEEGGGGGDSACIAALV